MARSLVCWVCCLLLFSLPARADVTGRIRGTIIDDAGKAVGGASVRVLNTLTGYSRSLRADSTGAFDAFDLPVGTYTVTITQIGHKTFSEFDIVLELDEVYVLHAALDAGDPSQIISVKAPPIQVDQTTIELGNEITGAVITDLPLNGRDWIELQRTVAGATFGVDRLQTVAANGNRTQTNNYMINGSDANDLMLNTPLYVPSPDAIQEVKVITSTLNPEYARNSGAIVNAVTKSGTNSWHGNAFEFYRDTFMNARDFFSQGVPQFHQNQFGGTVGGPLIHNKSFFSFPRRAPAAEWAFRPTPRFSAPPNATGFGREPIWAKRRRPSYPLSRFLEIPALRAALRAQRVLPIMCCSHKAISRHKTLILYPQRC
jgi:Carboxypeptidase regulatory-like domain